MKHLSLLLLISILAACSSTNATGMDPTPVINIESGVTKTPAPENTKVATSPSATATKDPMKDAPPGATGYENGRYFMVAENGDKYYYDKTREQFYWENKADGYTYFYFEKTAEQEAYWARPWIENYYAYDHWDFNAIPIDVWVKYGTPGSEKIVNMTHRDVLSSDDRSGATTEWNTFLLNKFNMTELKDLRAGLNSEQGLAYSFKFDNRTLDGVLGLNGGLEITFVSKEEIEDTAVRSYGNLGDVYLRYDGYENGMTKVRVASSLPLDKLLKNVPGGGPEYELRKMIYLALMNILISNPTEDLKNVAAMSDAGIIASSSAYDRSEDGEPDLQIIRAPDLSPTPTASP